MASNPSKTKPIATQFTVCPIDLDHPMHGTYAITVEYRGRGRWAVLRGRRCLGADGVWDWELIPSDRDNSWLETHRFDLETALGMAEVAAPAGGLPAGGEDGAAPVSDLIHWHGRPSALAEPPACCAAVFEKRRQEAVRQAMADVRAEELDERRRFILGAIEAVGAYQAAAVSVLRDDRERELVTSFAEHCIGLVRKAACICPDIDVSTIDGGMASSFVKGLDARCGLHGGSRT